MIQYPIKIPREEMRVSESPRRIPARVTWAPSKIWNSAAMARGVVVSQVVPSPWNMSVPISREFQALARANGLTEFTFSQMEGYISARFLVEALQRAGSRPTRAGLVQAMESMRNLNLSGYPIELSPSQHHSGRFVDLLMMGQGGKFTG